MLATATVVIPSYNSAKTLGQTLEALLAQTARARLDEIIVVDSSDDDATPELIRSFSSRGVRMITSGVRVMPARQRNIGAREARGDVLAFIDSDAFPEPDWLERILEARDQGILVGGGSYLVPDFQQKNAIALAQYYLEFNEYIPHGSHRPKKMLPTCNLFCDRALFLKVGGIPEIRASEDTLFGIKVSEHHPVMFLPEAAVRHIFRESKEHYLSNQQLLGKYIYVYRRHLYDPPYLRPGVVRWVMPLFLAVKLGRILPRIASAGPAHWAPFLRSSPEFLHGLLHWGRGFQKGSLEFDELKTTLEGLAPDES